MKITRRRLQLGLLAAAVASPSVLRARNRDVVRVGVLLPLSGMAAVEGLQTLKGIEMAADEFNASDRFDHAILIVREDDQADPARADQAVRRMIGKGEVPLIVGSSVSGVSLAATRAAREYRVPMLSGGAAGLAVTNDNPPGDPWFFRAFPDSSVQGEHAAQDTIRVLGRRRIAIIHDSTPYGHALAAQIRQVVAQEPGGQIVLAEGYDGGQQDFRPLLGRLRQIEPDAVHIGGRAADGAVILRQAAEMGLNTQFIGCGAMISDDFIRLAGPASEGCALATFYEPSTTNPHGRAFGERFAQRHGVPANSMAGLGFDAMAIALEALIRVGRPDGAAIQQMIYRGLSDFPIVTGPGRQTAQFTGQGGITYRMMMSRIHDGQRQVLAG